jgi:hypothetical protein
MESRQVNGKQEGIIHFTGDHSILRGNQALKNRKVSTQGIQERGKEIRTFMPRYGSINERRNQLHEVIRLSGMNLIIDDTTIRLSLRWLQSSRPGCRCILLTTRIIFKEKI